MAANKVRIKMTSSASTAQLRGQVNTATDGITLTGSYQADAEMHEFDVTIGGRYTLWEDPTGGTSYTEKTWWGGSSGVGKKVPGEYDQFVVTMSVTGTPRSVQSVTFTSLTDDRGQALPTKFNSPIVLAMPEQIEGVSVTNVSSTGFDIFRNGLGQSGSCSAVVYIREAI